MILYEDSEIIVCHKPAGVPVQSASVRVKDMVSILKNQTGGEIYVVHRLDQPVEGVLVFAKTKKAAADLSRQVTDGSMKKIYQAVVELPESVPLDGVSQGKCLPFEENQAQTPGKWHTLVDYLVKDARENRSFVVDEVNSEMANEKVTSAGARASAKKHSPSKNQNRESGAKRAELKYRILRTWLAEKAVNKVVNEALGKPVAKPTDVDRRDSLSVSCLKAACADDTKAARALVEIDLKTGRHHQIRVQMAHAGMPLVGDRKYNQKYNQECLSEASGVSSVDDGKNLALCAVSLTFRHPATKKKMTYQIQPLFHSLTE
ncbi:MAG: pseudouridine synthase [Lachnospiraceae bacterium]|nr:pseudouridine synthase [Lachnospiraceae bacterium]